MKKQFNELEISPEILRALDDMGFEETTAIQEQSIPFILAGKDVIGQSQTGTGKTAAFGIPAIQKIHPDGVTQVLILCPTRELAVQACDEIKKFSKYVKNISVVPIYGGQAIDRQIKQLRQGANIVIGTPGRIMDHLRRHTLKLKNLKMIILDEADEMLNMGFREDIEVILEAVPAERQTILFSATMPQAIINITKKYQTDPEFVKIAQQQLTVPKIQQTYYEVPFGKKVDVLCTILDKENPHRTIIFCNTKRMVDELVNELQVRGYASAGLHGDMKQMARTQVMNGFKSGNIDMLVATDVAARGIDVDDVEIVFNYDIPVDIEYYIHRIGRTGRAGKEGKAITFVVGRKESYELRDIQRTTKAKIDLKAIPTSNEIRETKMQKLVVKIREELEKTEAANREHNIEILESLMEDKYTSSDIACALLNMMTKTTAKKKDLAVKREAQGRSNMGGSMGSMGSMRSSKPSRGGKMTKMVIDIGTADRITAKHILGAITGETGLPGSAIGKITIENKRTYFEVPADDVSQVITSMEGCKIRGLKTNTAQAKRTF